MSEFNTEDITDRAGTGKPDLTNGFTINGSASGVDPHKHTESATEPSSPSNGDTWLDTDNDVYMVYIDGGWKDWFGSSFTLNYGDKASRVGFQTSASNEIHTWNITTLGNASDWKDLTRTSSARAAAASDATYGFLAGGNVNGSNGGDVDNIDYYAFANNTNASDFGDLSQSSSDNSACSGNGRGIIQMAFKFGAGEYDMLEYITIATPSNSTDFGDSTVARRPIGNVQVSNGTRGLFAGGYTSSHQQGSNFIDYITIATTGNATDFGDLTVATYGLSGCGSGSGDRGLFVSGYPTGRYGIIDYVTISTTGNATDFGDVFVGMSSNNGYFYGGSCNNATRAVMTSSFDTDRMEYVTMSTTGNASDFGDQVYSSSNRFQSCTSGNAS